MTIENEYVSDEDIESYRLDEIWDRYNPVGRGRHLPTFKYQWTIDKKRNIFLIFMRSGHEEFSNRSIFHIYWNGHAIGVSLEKHGLATTDSEGVSWKLLDLSIPEEFPAEREELISFLKEALTVYGYRGVLRKKDNYAVKFEF